MAYQFKEAKMVNLEKRMWSIFAYPEDLVGRLYGEKWQELRKIVLERDRFECVCCGDAITEEKGHVHHRLPLSQGGTNHIDNLEIRCRNCHEKKHPHMRYVR